MSRRRRGLASLIPDSLLGDEPPPSGELRRVPLDQVDPNPSQPREVFAPEELDALASSVRRHGILSPLVVRRHQGRFQLIAGERRLRAAALAGLQEVAVVVRDTADEAESLELALVENLQRSDLDPIEAARGYQALAVEHGYTQARIAQAVGRDRSTIANALRLLRLPEFVVDALRAGHISAGHARALAALERPEAQRRLLARIVQERASVRQAERWVAAAGRVRAGEAERQERARKVEGASARLGEALHTRVVIRPRKRGGGRILIEYGDEEHLDELLQQLMARRR